VLHALDAELARMGDDGPDGNDVAVAKYILHARLSKEQASLAAKPAAASVHTSDARRLRHALRPAANDRALKALDEVSSASVRAAVRRILAPDHRVVVSTVPRVR
jgi:hypothetical protein